MNDLFEDRLILLVRRELRDLKAEIRRCEGV